MRWGHALIRRPNRIAGKASAHHAREVRGGGVACVTVNRGASMQCIRHRRPRPGQASPTSAGALPCRTLPDAPGAISFSAFR